MKPVISILIKTLLIFSGFLLVIGCGYHIGYQPDVLPKNYKKVWVSEFKNDTHFNGSEYVFSKALSREFIQSKTLYLTARQSEAEAVVSGRIVEIRFGQIANEVGGSQTFSGLQSLPADTVLATSYRVYVTINLELIDVKDGSVLWKRVLKDEGVYDGPQLGQDYINSANANYSLEGRDIHIEELSKKMMHKAYILMVESF